MVFFPEGGGGWDEGDGCEGVWWIHYIMYVGLGMETGRGKVVADGARGWPLGRDGCRMALAGAGAVLSHCCVNHLISAAIT